MSLVEQLLKQLKDKQQELMESFVARPCNDMAEYNRRVGTHQGLVSAEEELLFLVRPKDANDDR